MLKLSENPPLRYPAEGSLASLSSPWWVAHTKSRFEKAFAWNLLRRGIPYFLPMVEKIRISGGKKRTTLCPLFRSYVFFCGDNAQRYQAMKTNCLCQTLAVTDRDTLIKQLQSIEQALVCKARIDLQEQSTVGRRCRIRAGAFQGFEGVVVQKRGETMIVLEVSILGQGAALHIDADLLEPTG